VVGGRVSGKGENRKNRSKTRPILQERVANRSERKKNVQKTNTSEQQKKGRARTKKGGEGEKEDRRVRGDLIFGVESRYF